MQVPTSETQAPPPVADPVRLAALGNVFRSAGFLEDRVADLLGADEFLTRHSREFGRAMYRTKTETPLYVLTRLFLLGVPVEAGAVARTLAPVTARDLEALRLVRADGGSLEPLVTILPHGDLWVAFDQPERIQSGAGSDLVSGITQSTASLANAAIRRRSRATLDLGTGSGVLAFMAAGWSDEVDAVDLNARAVAFAKFNAALNNRPNVRSSAGDLFAPVEGKLFDSILCNPPFAVTPSRKYVYRDSGMEGDAFARRIAREAPSYLREGGFLQMIFEWVHPRGEDWQARLASWFEASGCDAWVMRTETVDPLHYADKWIATTERAGAEAAESLYDEWIAWYGRQNYEAVSSGYVTMRKRSGAANWITIEDAAPVRSGPCGDQIEEGFRARDFLSGPDVDTRLLAARPVVSPDLEMVQRCEKGPGRWDIVASQVRIKRGMQHTANVDQQVAAILVRCDGSRTLREVLAEIASLLGVDVQRVVPACLPIVKGLLRQGLVNMAGQAPADLAFAAS